uniref:BZIP domain-containing protein n=1 Tax=Ciona savignyi TaxID=51511 RepID=H2Y4N4_CIOSA
MKLHMMTHGQNNPMRGRVSPYYVPHNYHAAYCNNASVRKTAIHQGEHGSDNNVAAVDLRQGRRSPLNIEHSAMAQPVNLYNDDRNEMSSEDLLMVEEHIRPLIKEELRYTIQSKRLARGLPGNVEIEYKRPHNDEISPETLIKRERRRERNKVAAAKCRFKKKILSEHLQEESEHLENVNAKLKREIAKLQDEKQKLIYMLNLHKPKCLVSKNTDGDFETDIMTSESQQSFGAHFQSTNNGNTLGVANIKHT